MGSAPLGRRAITLQAMPATPFCANCGVSLSATAKFCHRGAAPVGGDAPPRPVGSAGPAPANLLPWSIAAIAVLSFIAFVAGVNWRSGRPSAPVANAPVAVAAAPGRAPDISQMSPEERADRLFQRVMTYVAQGQTDSVRFFSPMAIQCMAAISPLDAHRR